MLAKIIGIVFIIISVVVLATSGNEGIAEAAPPAVIFILLGLFLIVKKFKSKEEKIALNAEKKARKEKTSRTLHGSHVAGLPLGEGSAASLIFEDSDVTISGGGNTFSLSYSKISNMEVKTDAEIQKAYVSSIGGAVGGAVLFGPLGAMIGGRAKEKKTTIVEHYLIITYNKDGKIEYLSFQIGEPWKASTVIQRFRPQFTGAKQVVL